MFHWHRCSIGIDNISAGGACSGLQKRERRSILKSTYRCRKLRIHFHGIAYRPGQRTLKNSHKGYTAVIDHYNQLARTFTWDTLLAFACPGPNDGAIIYSMVMRCNVALISIWACYLWSCVMPAEALLCNAFVNHDYWNYMHAKGR